jgi:hypothetical protein
MGCKAKPLTIERIKLLTPSRGRMRGSGGRVKEQREREIIEKRERQREEGDLLATLYSAAPMFITLSEPISKVKSMKGLCMQEMVIASKQGKVSIRE